MSSLNLFQIKQEITDPDDVIVDREKLWSHPIEVAGQLLGVLYVQRTAQKPPRWLPYFEDLVDFTGIRLETASAAAVLLINRQGRLYAATFGHGRWLLYEGIAEPRFGLRVTLNSIDPASIRSIDHKRLEAVSRLTREQLSRDSGLEHFGLDVERDLLRAVTGAPSDESLGTRLSGADQLAVVGSVPIRKLGKQIDRYATIAGKDTYHKQFRWVDNIEELTDPDLQYQLDDLLVSRINAEELERIWLAIPDVLDWSELAGFRYRQAKHAPVFQNLDLRDYFDDRRGPGTITLPDLRRDRLRCVNEVDGTDRQSWSIHRSITAELDLEDGTYILSEGLWYRIDNDFLKSIDQSIKLLKPTATPLPPFKDGSEKAYNERVEKTSNGHFALMDRKPIPTGRRGPVELCDLYGSNQELVHVKIYGASSVLSHLFSQGVVSAQLLLEDIGFRKSANKQLPVSHRLKSPNAAITPSDFEVAYAVVSRPGKVLELPFFSKVNLRNAAQVLRRQGYKVTLTAIENKT